MTELLVPAAVVNGNAELLQSYLFDEAVAHSLNELETFGSLARDDDVFSDDDAGESVDYEAEHSDSVFAHGQDALVDDVKSRAAAELAHGRKTLLEDEQFVDAVTDSNLPAGARVEKHLGAKVVVFALPKPVYTFPTTVQFRSSLLQRQGDGRVQFVQGAAQKLIRFLFDQHPAFPVQIALAGVGSFTMGGSSFRKNQVWIASKEFVCAAIRHNCETRLSAGFTVNDPETLTVTFHDAAMPCVHVYGAEYGQTRGDIRKSLIDGGSRPYNLTKAALDSLSSERLFSGNRVGVPTHRAARSISGEASRAGQLHSVLSLSLALLVPFYEDEDKKRAADQLLSGRQKRSVFGLVFGVQSKPVNVVLTTEGAIRVYLKMLDTEPGFWADYTGNLCKDVVFDGEKPKSLLNFMLVLAGDGHGLTCVEIITSDQTATNLHQQLLCFQGVCERVAGCRVGKPRRITIDCGMNILLAMCSWANGEDIKTFLCRRWSELWEERPNTVGKTLLCWCIAHVHRAAVHHVKTASVFSCAAEMRRAFVAFTFRIFEVIEKAATIGEVDALVDGCNSFLLAQTLRVGEANVFGGLTVTVTADDRKFRVFIDPLSLFETSIRDRDGDTVGNPFFSSDLQQYLDKTWWPYYPLFGDLAVGRRMRRTAATVETVHRLRKSTQILRRGTKYRLDTYVYHMRSHFFGAARRFITDAARIDAKEADKRGGESKGDVKEAKEDILREAWAPKRIAASLFPAEHVQLADNIKEVMDKFKWRLIDVVDRVGQFDRTVHLSTALISNLINKKVAPASELTISGLNLWISAVRALTASDQKEQEDDSAASAAFAESLDSEAAAPAAVDADGDEPMVEPVRHSGRARKQTARAAAAAGDQSGFGLGGQ